MQNPYYEERKKLVEEQPELISRLPKEYMNFMNTKFIEKYFPIRFLTSFAITQLLEQCFLNHIKPRHVDNDDPNYELKSKFMTVDKTYDSLTICFLTFLFPDSARFLTRCDYDTDRISVVKLFKQRVGSYFSKTKDEFEARWVKGIFDLTTSSQSPIKIITCYPVSTYDRCVHLKPYNNFQDPTFQPTFDYIDFCTTDYNRIKDNYDLFCKLY